jgi:DNA-directed RNA polymerase subunit RPC12/RpoP
MRRPRISYRTTVVLAVVIVAVWLITRQSVLAVTVAVIAGWLILRFGYAVLRALATPLPPPPPPGELRTVRITYRCSICGTEVRMTTANDEVPEPPRHCQEEMELVAPIE